MKVKVREDLLKFAENHPDYTKVNWGFKYTNENVNLPNEMIELAGSFIEVEEYKGSYHYEYEDKDGSWAWRKEWLELTPDELNGVEL